MIDQHATEERDRAVADVLEAQIVAVERAEGGRIRAFDKAKTGQR